MNSRPIHLLHVFPSFEVGGAQMRFSRLVKAHGARYRHTIIALDGITDMASRLPAEAQVEFHALPFDKRHIWSNLALFRRTINAINPAVLVTYNWGAIEWALANRGFSSRRHVHIEDGFGPEEAQKQLRRRVWARRLALSGLHTTVVLPSRALEQLALRQWKLPANRTLYIPNGIDCERFVVEVSSRKSRPAPLIVGTVATLRLEKNIPRLINAFSRVAAAWPNDALQLIIVGDGPEKKALQALVRTSPYADRIQFTGATPTPEDWYKKMDVFALSSDTEQMPFSVLEAMAAGLPIISPAIGDVADLVSSENASQIVTKDDEAAYRSAMTLLLSDAALRLRIGGANQRKAFAEFDEQLMAERYAEVFG